MWIEVNHIQSLNIVGIRQDPDPHPWSFLLLATLDLVALSFQFPCSLFFQSFGSESRYFSDPDRNIFVGSRYKTAREIVKHRTFFSLCWPKLYIKVRSSKIFFSSTISRSEAHLLFYNFYLKCRLLISRNLCCVLFFFSLLIPPLHGVIYLIWKTE